MHIFCYIGCGLMHRGLVAGDLVPCEDDLAVELNSYCGGTKLDCISSGA